MASSDGTSPGPLTAYYGMLGLVTFGETSWYDRKRMEDQGVRYFSGVPLAARSTPSFAASPPWDTSQSEKWPRSAALTSGCTGSLPRASRR